MPSCLGIGGHTGGVPARTPSAHQCPNSGEAGGGPQQPDQPSHTHNACRTHRTRYTANISSSFFHVFFFLFFAFFFNDFSFFFVLFVFFLGCTGGLRQTRTDETRALRDDTANAPLDPKAQTPKLRQNRRRPYGQVKAEAETQRVERQN